MKKEEEGNEEEKVIENQDPEEDATTKNSEEEQSNPAIRKSCTASQEIMIVKEEIKMHKILKKDTAMKISSRVASERSRGGW